MIPKSYGNYRKYFFLFTFLCIYKDFNKAQTDESLVLIFKQPIPLSILEKSITVSWNCTIIIAVKHNYDQDMDAFDKYLSKH